MQVLITVFRFMVILLIVGYIAINFYADLPRFLIVENIILAVLYALLLYLTYSKPKTGYLALSFLAAFNAGRVSRSIIAADGSLMELAIQHIPLLAWIIAIGLLAFYIGLKEF